MAFTLLYDFQIFGIYFALKDIYLTGSSCLIYQVCCPFKHIFWVIKFQHHLLFLKGLIPFNWISLHRLFMYSVSEIVLCVFWTSRFFFTRNQLHSLSTSFLILAHFKNFIDFFFPDYFGMAHPQVIVLDRYFISSNFTLRGKKHIYWWDVIGILIKVRNKPRKALS